MNETLLELRDLCIRTHERILVDGVDIVVQRSKVTAVVGNSGSGKSLSARAAMGVLDVDPGLVRGSLRYPGLKTGNLFEGVHNRGLRAQRSLLRSTAKYRGGYVSYSPQSASSALNPGRTIGRQLQISIGRRDTPPNSVSDEIRRVLDEVGLPHRASAALPKELSGGMAQRAALALAIAPAPKVMIADEPETGLDPVLRRVVTELMLQVAADHHVALMLISHNMDTVRRIADTVVRIEPEGSTTYDVEDMGQATHDVEDAETDPGDPPRAEGTG